MLKINRQAFTLVEVLISVVIIAMVSITSFMGFYVVSRANESAHNRLNAVTLGQAALEEVRGVAKSNFDDLENPSRFTEDIDQTRFPGFHRSIIVTAQTTQIKKTDVTISWQERGQDRQLNMSTIISLPQEPLPANIHGTVTNLSGGATIPNALLRLEYVGNASLTVSTTSSNTAGSVGEFTFVDASGNFALKPGSWNLTITCSGFIDSAVIEVSNLESGEDRPVSIPPLKPAGPAHITGKIIKSDTMTYLNIPVNLYEGATKIGQVNNGSSGFDFNIPFTTEAERCFTINTNNAYKMLYAGNFCDSNGWGKNYNYEGISTSVIRDGGAVVCSNPWNGSSAADRVCLSLGETENLGNLTLYPLPTATISGQVRDSSGLPVPGAAVTISLHDYSYQLTLTTDANGNYTTSFPAEQELFPDNINYYIQARAGKTMEQRDCCDVVHQTYVRSVWYRIGPVTSGQSKICNIVLPTSANCGNVHGVVRDQSTNAVMAGVVISINERPGTLVTDASGSYQYACPDLGYCLPATYQQITMQSPGYYTFANQAEVYYNKQLLLVQLNMDVAYNVKMLLIRYGTIRGKVVVAGTNNPISGATVNLDNYSDGTNDLSAQTDSSGNFVFPSVIESWPSSIIVGNSNYIQTVRNHKITVSKENYTTKLVENINLDASQDKDLGAIGLSGGGGL